jgi:hypothetical protein
VNWVDRVDELMTEKEECMSKMGEYAIQIEQLERQNYELSCALRWCLVQLAHIDHDCHASPDDGCGWCQQYWEYGNLVGMNQPEGDQPDE